MHTSNQVLCATDRQYGQPDRRRGKVRVNATTLFKLISYIEDREDDRLTQVAKDCNGAADRACLTIVAKHDVPESETGNAVTSN